MTTSRDEGDAGGARGDARSNGRGAGGRAVGRFVTGPGGERILPLEGPAVGARGRPARRARPRRSRWAALQPGGLLHQVH